MKRLTIDFDEKQYNWLTYAYEKYLKNMERYNRYEEEKSKNPKYIDALDFEDWIAETAFEKVRTDYTKKYMEV